MSGCRYSACSPTGGGGGVSYRFVFKASSASWQESLRNVLLQAPFSGATCISLKAAARHAGRSTGQGWLGRDGNCTVSNGHQTTRSCRINLRRWRMRNTSDNAWNQSCVKLPRSRRRLCYVVATGTFHKYNALVMMAVWYSVILTAPSVIPAESIVCLTLTRRR